VIAATRLLVLLSALMTSLTAAIPPTGAASESWQADRVFAIDPAQVPGLSAGAAKFNYRLLDPQGKQIGLVIDRPGIDPLDWIEVPPLAGSYLVEAWLEDAAGQELRRASTTLHFDNVAPQPAAPHGPSHWLLGEEPALLTIGHPEGPQPLSGIRGYAISLDRGSGSAPCASLSLCTAAETDLPGGAADDSISLGTLPEGITYARVVAVSGAGVPSPPRSAVLRVDATPPRLSLLGVPDGWSAGPVRIAALAQDALSGMTANGTTGPLTAISVDGGAPSATPGDTATSWVNGSGIHSIALFARDAAGNPSGKVGSAAVPTAVIRVDEDPPRVEFAAAQDPAEPERIEALVTDSLSGPGFARGSIAVRLAATRARFEELPTRVTAGRLVAHWDSDSYPPGKYEFLATGFDVAGNATTGASRARGGKMVLVNPLKTQVSLTSRLSEGNISGYLRRVGGGPAAGQQIAVVETFAAGAVPQRRVTYRRTDAGGAFSLRLEPGPSRDAVVYFAGTPTLTKAAGGGIRLEVPTGIRLRASATKASVGGKPIVFNGAVRALGASGAVRGLPVELQFRYPGAGWSGFRTVEADRRGRFRYAYRFSDDDSRGVRFQFRAHVKGREGWPYEPGSSRPVIVTGR
jgi:hypothetical protein